MPNRVRLLTVPDDGRAELRRWPRGQGAPGGTHNSSLHNMLRAGFTVRYERQSWVWQADSASGRL
jgi:hypothetical protein